ncbi:MAG TPA: hypothetical protein ENI75_03750 [Mizugakiibacter sp.]|nr:hypothetical protein [Mizugakiibacter sp.]
MKISNWPAPIRPAAVCVLADADYGIKRSKNWPRFLIRLATIPQVRQAPRSLKGPFNIEARRQAGFTDVELAQLGFSPT